MLYIQYIVTFTHVPRDLFYLLLIFTVQRLIFIVFIVYANFIF